jgi:hypothetical protein
MQPPKKHQLTTTVAGQATMPHAQSLMPRHQMVQCDREPPKSVTHITQSAALLELPRWHASHQQSGFNTSCKTNVCSGHSGWRATHSKHHIAGMHACRFLKSSWWESIRRCVIHDARCIVFIQHMKHARSVLVREGTYGQCSMLWSHASRVADNASASHQNTLCVTPKP